MGRGRYGNVYVARNIKDDLIVALKVMNKSNLFSDGYEPQIRREIEIHSRLNHPNILKMYGYFWDDTNLYFILEFACGRSLYEQMTLQEEKRFSEAVVSNYIY